MDLDLFGPDDDVVDAEGLPQAKIITRAAINASDFDAERVLLDHSSFQTLRDLQVQTRELENTLRSELIEMANNTFGEILTASGEVLSNGEAPLESVDLDLLSYQRESETATSRLNAAGSTLDEFLDETRMLSKQEHDARELIRMVDFLDLIEQRLPRVALETDTIAKSECLEILVKSHTSARLIAKTYRGYRIVLNSQNRISQLGELLKRELLTVSSSKLLPSMYFLSSEV